MNKKLALIGFAEALAAPEVAWSLIDAGFQVVAFGRHGRRAPLHHSRLTKVHKITSPETDLESALADLRALLDMLGSGRDSSPSVLMPLDDASVFLCSRLQLDEGAWRLAGPQGPCAELALNKNLQTCLAKQSGLNVPESWSIKSRKDAAERVQTGSYPVILKAAECSSLRNGRIQKCRLWICSNEGELDRALQEWDECSPLLAQRFVTGIGEGVFGIATPDGIQGWSSHRRLRMMNPHGSGSSACVSQNIDPEAVTAIEEMIRRSNWRGLFMIEMLRDIDGTLWFVELNGRPWGSMALARRQGFEYPAWQATLALGDCLGADLPEVHPGIVCRNVGREIMHILFVLRGPKSTALRQWPPFWQTVAEMARVRRGDCIYNWRRHDANVCVADCYYTVRDNVLKARN